MAIKDDFFGPAYIDVDEWRDEPVRYRYVHGGFEGTDTRFSFYFPPKEHYDGRFIQFLEGGPGGNESTALNPMPFVASIQHAIACGAYLVESNQGHLGMDLSGAKGDKTIITFRASAETARFSKQVAAKMYGQAPHHGYVFGGSGGGVRSLSCLENVDDVWDGGVPFVMPHTSQARFFSMQLNALRVLQPVLRQITDAVEVGGSGNPFVGLSPDQADVLAVMYKAGFPRRIGLDNPLEAVLTWTWAPDSFNTYDPTYFDDFWSKPGYLGHDHPDRLAHALIELETTVTRVFGRSELQEYQPSTPVVDKYGIGDMARVIGAIMGTTEPRNGITIAAGDTGSMGCATVKILSGAAAGRELYVIGVIGDVLVGSAVGEAGDLLFAGVEPGDRVQISNRKYLAYCYHHRHQVEPEFPEWAHLCVDGNPLYPQRPVLEYVFANMWYTHNVGGKKMIIVQNMLDRGTYPCAAVRYQELLRKRIGTKLDEQFRLWFVEHAQHVPASMIAATGHPEVHSQLIDYEGHVQQAVRDLIDWVEHGKEPPASSAYRYSTDSAVTLAPTAAQRGGIQAVVRARANGKARADVATGKEVVLEADIEVPPGGGRITRIEWDPEGNGTYPVRDPAVDGTATTAATRITHRYAKAGSYFPAVRVTAQRDGDATASLFQLQNLGRARVVVA